MTSVDFRRLILERMPRLAIAREPEIIHELAQHLSDLYQEGRACGLDHDAALARAIAALPEHGESLARQIRSASRGWGGSVADRCVAS